VTESRRRRGSSRPPRASPLATCTPPQEHTQPPANPLTSPEPWKLADLYRSSSDTDSIWKSGCTPARMMMVAATLEALASSLAVSSVSPMRPNTTSSVARPANAPATACSASDD
jgi:hypothetical protein